MSTLGPLPKLTPKQQRLAWLLAKGLVITADLGVIGVICAGVAYAPLGDRVLAFVAVGYMGVQALLVATRRMQVDEE
jgi:hypothetical protein